MLARRSDLIPLLRTVAGETKLSLLDLRSLPPRWLDVSPAFGAAATYTQLGCADSRSQCLFTLPVAVGTGVRTELFRYDPHAATPTAQRVDSSGPIAGGAGVIVSDLQQGAYWWNGADARLVDLATEPPSVGALLKGDVPFARAVALRRRPRPYQPAPQ